SYNKESHVALYVVEKFLGEGSFGKVAKCRNLTTNQEVAIKIIKPSNRNSAPGSSFLDSPLPLMVHSWSPRLVTV
uniref:Protein kinase domain-containing protein n=1 Tax=Oryzias melastigma TaxID=30732 RepID=A0A3B3CXW9_ORYME